MTTTADVSFLQISDSHLFSTTEETLIGVNTASSLEAVVELASSEKNITGVLATGDLSQDGSLESYRNFSKAISALNLPVHWIPGNHDNPEYFHQAKNFPLSGRSVIEAGNWRILLLDSVIPGEDSGYLAQSEMNYVKQHAINDGRHTLLVLHHQTIPCKSLWLDTMILKNSSDFLQLVETLPAVKAVLNGHIHQERLEILKGVSYISSPSTCFQFTPDTDDFSLDTRLPGYRHLLLKANGEIETSVIRLKNYNLHVDGDVPGY